MTALQWPYESDGQSYEELVAERDLLRVERDQFALLLPATDPQPATEPAQVIDGNLADVQPVLDMLVGLHRTTAALNGDLAALAEVAAAVNGWGQRELVGYLAAAVQRLAGEAL